MKSKVLTVSEYENAKAAYEGAKASLEAAKQNLIGRNMVWHNHRHRLKKHRITWLKLLFIHRLMVWYLQIIY
jgi:hypothetical protein